MSKLWDTINNGHARDGPEGGVESSGTWTLGP